MANEIQVSGSLAFNAPLLTSSPLGRAISGLLANSLTVAGPSGSVISIATSATAIPLNGIATPGWAWFCNRDPVNYVQLMNGSGGAVFARLLPGEFFLGPLDNGCVPYAKANAAAVELEFLITSR